MVSFHSAVTAQKIIGTRQLLLKQALLCSIELQLGSIQSDNLRNKIGICTPLKSVIYFRFVS